MTLGYKGPCACKQSKSDRLEEMSDNCMVGVWILVLDKDQKWWCIEWKDIKGVSYLCHSKGQTGCVTGSFNACI